MYSTEGMVAKWLQDWRNELFHKYKNEDINQNPDKFLNDYMRVIDYVYQKSGGNWEDILHELWLLGGEIENYLKGAVNTFSVGKLLTENYSMKTELEALRQRLSELDSRLSSESSEKLSLKERLDKILKEYEDTKAKLKNYVVAGFVGGVVVGAVLIWLIVS